MGDRFDVGSQVGLGALLDTDCFELALLDAELLADATLWAGGGAADVLASHPRVTCLVEAAVVSPRPQVRATVAGRPDLDTPLYSMLASDPERVVRARVAANRGAPAAVLDRLVHDPDPAVCDMARRELRRREVPVAHAS